jgi:hypothetical protein
VNIAISVIRMQWKGIAFLSPDPPPDASRLGSRGPLNKSGASSVHIPQDRLPATFMATLSLRFFGLCLLILAILIPSCQAVFPPDAANAARPFMPGFVRD